jgi:endonuclease/exonuclease/phosphatase family metal-dependent hydrolase
MKTENNDRPFDPRNTPSARLGWRGTLLSALLLITALLSQPLAAQNRSCPPAGKRDLTVMTRNLYVGADFLPIMTETNAVLIPLRVAQAFATIVANDFPARAKGLAREIVREQPELVGLQEVSLIRVQSPGDAIFGNPQPAEAVAYDYLEILLDELASLGAHYRLAVAVTNMDLELFASASIPDLMAGRGVDVRLTDRDAILVRADHPPGHLWLFDPRAANFENNLVLSVAGQAVEVLRGWCSVDVFTRGRVLRFINAHLDNDSVYHRTLQAGELLTGPAHTRLPVVLVGDFNSDANGMAPTEAYPVLRAGGFRDAWSETHPHDPGLTWGHDEFLADPTLAFVQRLDLILFRGHGVNAEEATRVDDLLGRAQPPLWGSDHAGVAATLRLK